MTHACAHLCRCMRPSSQELADGGRAYIICPLVGESSAKGFTDTKVRHHEGHGPMCMHCLCWCLTEYFLASLYDLPYHGVSVVFRSKNHDSNDAEAGHRFVLV